MNNDLYIIKVGTNALVDAEGAIRTSLITELFAVIKQAHEKNDRVIIVTSGASRIGRGILGDMTASRKIAAAVGHPAVFEAYQRQAHKEKIVLAEFLLTRSHIVRRDLFALFKSALQDMFSRGIVPIMNENDVLAAGTDRTFGDNDSMAQALAVSLGAKKLIIVSDIAGLYDCDPTKNPEAQLIDQVDAVTDRFISYCSKSAGGHGAGGMLSKLKSIRLCTKAGIDAQIVSGFKKGNVLKAFEGEHVGTRFLAQPAKRNTTIFRTMLKLRYDRPA